MPVFCIAWFCFAWYSWFIFPSMAWRYLRPLFDMDVDIFSIFDLLPNEFLSHISLDGVSLTLVGKLKSSIVGICNPLLWNAIAPPVALIMYIHSWAPICRWSFMATSHLADVLCRWDATPSQSSTNASLFLEIFLFLLVLCRTIPSCRLEWAWSMVCDNTLQTHAIYHVPCISPAISMSMCSYLYVVTEPACLVLTPCNIWSIAILWATITLWVTPFHCQHCWYIWDHPIKACYSIIGEQCYRDISTCLYSKTSILLNAASVAVLPGLSPLIVPWWKSSFWSWAPSAMQKVTSVQCWSLLPPDQWFIVGESVKCLSSSCAL